MHKHAAARGVGGMVPGNFWNLEAMRLYLRPFWGKYDASRRPDDRVSHVRMSTLPIASYSNGSIIRLPRKPHPSQMRFVRLIIRLEERKVDGRKTRKNSFALFAAISQVLTLSFKISPVCLRACVGVRRALPVIGDAKQATSEGESGPVETGLTGPAATALLCSYQFKLTTVAIFTW